MATRPTVGDLISFVSLYDPNDRVTDAFGEVLATALALIESRVNLPAAFEAATPDENAYPQEIALAVLLTAARLAKRSSSPEGVSGFGDLGVVRIGKNDPDVETLITRFKKLDGFA